MSKYIYEATFKEYDKDNSGFIDYNELKSLLDSTFKKAGIPLSEDAIKYHV
jgi:Ca2+-binding EF-hand superfamily protein